MEAHRFRYGAGLPALQGGRSVLLGPGGGQLLSGVFEQLCHVEDAPVAWHAHRLDLDAAKWHWFRKLHKVTNPRNGFGAEE